jgi:hypothetical protein
MPASAELFSEKPIESQYASQTRSGVLRMRKILISKSSKESSAYTENPSASFIGTKLQRNCTEKHWDS